MKKLTVLCVALVLVFAALPALAQDKAEWSFYGQARMWTAWESASAETANYANVFGPTFFALARAMRAGNSQALGWNPGFGMPQQDDDELAWKLGGTARIGANVKWGNIGGEFQYRQNENPLGGDFLATTALLYGYWDFGPGRLIVGKDWSPYHFITSDMCGPGGGECSGVGFGTIYGGRRSQLKLRMGGFQFALIEPVTRSTNAAGTAGVPNAPFDVATGNFLAAPAGGYLDTDQTLPAISAAYTFNLGPSQLYIGGLYNTLTHEVSTATGIKDIDVDSWILGLGWKVAFGPFYVNGALQYSNNVTGSTNASPLGMIPRYQFIDSTNNYNTEDSTFYSAQLVLGFNLTSTFKLEGGVIWETASADSPSAGPSISADQDYWTYYLLATWSPAKNVYIVPEFGVIDATKFKVTGRNDVDLGSLWWLGIKWQINF